MSAKKRSARKGKVQRQGVSGNPVRRAEQLQQQKQAAAPDMAALREFAYRMIGGTTAEPWWAESHQRIIDRFRALPQPPRLVELETQACQSAGDEFYDLLNSRDSGLHPAQWLRALVEATGKQLRAELADGADGWQRLWLLLCMLALSAPRTPDEVMSEDELHFRAQFPSIKDPYVTALAETDRAEQLLADYGLAADIGCPVEGWQPAGEPLVARDVYGSRFLVMAPFGFVGQAADHWYAWDVDSCWNTDVVGAGVFGSAEEALQDWRDAAGPAASGAVLSPGAAGLTTRLLAPVLQAGPLAEALEGTEPRELLHEYYRMRRRARALTESAGGDTNSISFDTDLAYDAFESWHLARHGDGHDTAAAADMILNEWGPRLMPDERAFYACSPHRIEMAARLIRDGHFPGDANQALRLLPEWTQWCIEQSGLDGDAAARSREAARAAAAALVNEEDDGPVDEDDDKALFRRQE